MSLSKRMSKGIKVHLSIKSLYCSYNEQVGATHTVMYILSNFNMAFAKVWH